MATKITENQCKHIKSQTLATAPQASVIISNFQRNIFAGPFYLIGLKNGTIYGLQGQKHIYALINLENQRTSQDPRSEIL